MGCGSPASLTDRVARGTLRAERVRLTIRFDLKEPMWTGYGPVQQRSIVDFRDGAFRSEYSANRIMMNNQSMGPPPV